ncbi:DUF924 family protein [Paremcibacter congregatus]|uniref:DUF924 family protein n=1 Tax=Paremcibacter congregatus TaxID=2043170 RepID=UPI0030ECFDE3|tara:strand:+ start:1899 stop:2462 length:564 start_codon:yes stop_codon:yes gene_type:complete
MLTPAELTRLAAIYSFWFEELTPQDWFTSSDPLDEQIQSRFMDSYQHFKDMDLAEMDFTAQQVLSLILLLDQMPRNMFRGTPQAFATDAKALELSYAALARRLDLALPDIEKSFIYLPLEHSEDIKDQELCVTLFQQRTTLELQTDYAVRHFKVISRFGRFPHRNAILGRPPTTEEEAYLAEGGDAF